MKITVAETAGFCFGVNRAVKLVYSLIESGKKVCTLGPIIHNPQMVDQLAARGALTVNTPSEVPEGYTVVIRSHGVARRVKDELVERNIEIADATCPFVAKIQQIAQNESRKGRLVFIAGDEEHPEVLGIRGHCLGRSIVFKDENELDQWACDHPGYGEKAISMVAQTTFSINEWDKCVNKAKKVYTNAVIFDTICNATVKRQKEADILSKQSDLMLIVGGRQSSNTAKLRDVCAQHCQTVLIEKADELNIDYLRKAHNIGVTAGASTPASIIKEVLLNMSEILNNEAEINPEVTEPIAEATEPAVEPVAEEFTEPVAEEAAEPVVQKTFDEMTFEEALEASLQNLNTGEKVHGVVVGIAPNEVQVDVGRKQAGYIPAVELSGDPNARVEDLVKIGDEMDLLIMRTNDQEGTIMLSKRRLDAVKGWEDIIAASEDDSIMTGVVTDIIKGGVLAVTKGVRVFIPASQATANRNDNLEDLKGKEVSFRIIEVNRGRRRAVGSIRAVTRELRKAQEDAFWADVQKDKTYTGTVKSLTSYGAFVDIGGVDGMIHVSELSWRKIKHPSDVVAIGDMVDVFIKEIDAEKRRISLGYKKQDENPWELLRKDYPVGTAATVKVVGMTQFGAFAQIIPGIDGLIHISQIADRRINKPQDVLSVGDEVLAKITEIDFDKHRISLSIRALINEGIVEAPADKETEETAADEPAAGEEVSVTEEPPVVVAETEVTVETAVPAQEEAVPAEAPPEDTTPAEAPADETPAEDVPAE